MIKIVTVIGARPQIIKAAAISRAIQTHFSNHISEIIIHTGQHYDENMSQVFFEEMHIPPPDYNLSVGSGSHGKQTAEMIKGIEEIIIKENPSCVLLYGDTNSTLAGAIAASKIHTPVVHIEAGLRSFNKKMPEEINRIMCDHVSTLLFAPTKAAIDNLRAEGIGKANTPAKATIDAPAVFHCGDIMYDNSLFFASIADKKESLLNDLSVEKGDYILCTIHRDINTDNEERLNSIFSSLIKIAGEYKISLILPLHPRTSKLLNSKLNQAVQKKLKEQTLIKIIPPFSFLEMIVLEKNSSMIITDSGGVQKEAFFFEKPCIILRKETEWIELVECGAAIIADADEQRIISAYKELSAKKNLSFSTIFGDGKASEFICKTIIKHFENN